MKRYLLLALFVFFAASTAMAQEVEPTFAAGEGTEHAGVVEKEEDAGAFDIGDNSNPFLVIALLASLALNALQTWGNIHSVPQGFARTLFSLGEGAARILTPKDTRDEKFIAGLKEAFEAWWKEKQAQTPPEAPAAQTTNINVGVPAPVPGNSAG